MSVLITAADFEALAWTYFTNAHADGVVHAEVSFDAQSHTQRGVEFSTVFEGYEKACLRTRTEFGMSTRLILCFLRHLPALAGMETLQAAVDCGALNSGIVAGVGLDSLEIGFPAELFTEVCKVAKEKGLNRTAHAGEVGDCSYISGALDALDCQRIDHGIRLPEDPELMARIARDGTLLTLCPFSNIHLEGVKTLADLPIRTFIDAGVKFSINCDDPGYLRYALRNYCAIQETFNLTINEWVKIAADSIEGSWVEAERNVELRRALLACRESCHI